jgi:hypothetical protein
MSRPKYDQLKVEFINGKMSLRELAEAHGVKYDALRQVAARGEWMDERHRASQIVTATAIDSQIKTRVSELSQFNKDDLQMAKAIRASAARILTESSQPVDGRPPKKLTLGELGQLARVVSDAQKIGRLALGASTDNHELTGAAGGPVQLSDVPLAEYEAALKKALDQYL